MNILFTGIGGPTPLGLAKSIKLVWPDARCIGMDASPWAPSLYQSDVFSATYRVPPANDSTYWTVVGDIVRKENVDFAFVVPETEVLMWAERAQRHPLPCAVHIPEYTLAAFCFDKLRVAEFLFPLGLTPETIYLDNASVLNDDTFGLDYPYWIRVKSGAGALGALCIRSRKDLATWLALHGNRQDFMASAYLPGRNYACKLLYHQGDLVQSASGERIEYLLSAAAPSGISGMCARGRLLNRPDLVERSKMALESISQHLNIPLHGMFTVDFKEDERGVALITEINIRHVSFTLAYALGGVNFAATTLSFYVKNAIMQKTVNEFTSEDYFIRGVDAPLRLVSQKEYETFM